MSTGYTGYILDIDLTTGKYEKLELGTEFYRMYMGGSAIGAYFLLKEPVSAIDPLSEKNILIISPGVTTGASVSGVSRCCVTSLSPLTGTIADSQAGGSFGPTLKRAGLDAIVIRGRAGQLSYLYINDNEIKILNASHLKGRMVSDVIDELNKIHGKKGISIIQCGPAGEKMVRFANLLADRNDAAGRKGMGAVFGSKNLRAVVVQSGSEIQFRDREGLKNLNNLASKRLPDSGFPATLRQYGTPGVVGFQARAGNFATHNYSRGIHEDYGKLDGENFEPKIGAGKTTCYGCVVGCRRKVKTNGKYNVTDKLGGPEFETLGLLGSNLDITDPEAVSKANELCNEYGLDTITMGSAAGYIFECMEKGLIKPDKMNGKNLSFGDPESLFWLIETISRRDGAGDIIAEGFQAMLNSFGRETLPYAVHVKGDGLAVHMPQVKPSQALMYAVSPIGPDHMSSEHDWLLASGSDDSWGLGIMGKEDAPSTSLNKVRMTVYSQFYYSLLDTLSLCMFCWGPGNLFTYSELADLVKYTTGWGVTFWELMKAGERRINMMKQVNLRRGFTKNEDRLPERLFNPLPDGPSEGRHVDREAFKNMLIQYYSLMGWDPETGNPTNSKLMELGLEWTI